MAEEKELGPDGKEWAKTKAGYAHVESIIASAIEGPAGKVWYGHIVREAFVAGAEWQEQRTASTIERLSAIEQERDALRVALKPFVAIANDMFVDPENGWSDTDIISLEADPDFGSFAHLKAEDFRRAFAALNQTRTDATEATDGH